MILDSLRYAAKQRENHPNQLDECVGPVGAISARTITEHGPTKRLLLIPTTTDGVERWQRIGRPFKEPLFDHTLIKV